MKNTKARSRLIYICEASAIAALYVVITVAIGPLGSSAIQCRIPEAFCILAIFTPAAIPGMTIVNPSDAVEARAAVEAALTTNGPFYLRFGRFAVPVINDNPEYKFELGKGVCVANGKDVTIVATGVMVSLAFEAKELLAQEGIDARIINIHTIKPIDKDILAKAAQETGALVTAEEHNIIGGLGAAVTEAICESCPVPVIRVGMNDTYGHSGTVPALLEAYGLTPAKIAEAAKKAISMKK